VSHYYWHRGDDVLFDFAGIDRVPGCYHVVLEDRRLMQMIDLRQYSRYRFVQGAKGHVSEEEARFVLLVGDGDYPHVPEPGFESPRQTGLLGNYPNPFRTGTVFRIQLAEPEPIALHIYDVRGALVRELTARGDRPGYHELVWRGEDNRGRPAPAGVYFCRMPTSQNGELRRIAKVE